MIVFVLKWLVAMALLIVPCIGLLEMYTAQKSSPGRFLYGVAFVSWFILWLVAMVLVMPLLK